MVGTKLRYLCRRGHRRVAVPLPLEGGGSGAYEKLPLEEGRAMEMPPKGHVVVYVECERVFLPVEYVNHPLFAKLLEEAEEEYGFSREGGITVPRSASEFEDVRTRIAATSAVEMRRGCVAYGRMR